MWFLKPKIENPILEEFTEYFRIIPVLGGVDHISSCPYVVMKPRDFLGYALRSEAKALFAQEGSGYIVFFFYHKEMPLQVMTEVEKEIRMKK